MYGRPMGAYESRSYERHGRYELCADEQPGGACELRAYERVVTVPSVSTA